MHPPWFHFAHHSLGTAAVSQIRWDRLPPEDAVAQVCLMAALSVEK